MEVDELNLTYFQQCSPGASKWLETWQFVALLTHSISFVVFPFNLFAGWCIYKKTPQKMSGARIMLLNLHIWQSSFDIIICTLATPYFFFPCMCGLSLGLLNIFRIPLIVQLFLGQLSLTGLIASLVVAIEYRHFIMVETRFKIVRPKIRQSLYAALYLYAIFFLFPLYFEGPDQKLNKLACLKSISCPPVEFLEGATFFFTSRSDSLLYRAVTFVVVNYIIGFHYFIHSMHYILSGSKRDFKISQSTKNTQITSFYHLLIAGLIPIIILSVPAFFYLFSITNSYYNQALNNFGTISFSLHGACATSVIIFLIPPYREYTLGFFRTDKITPLFRSAASLQMGIS